MNKPDQLTLGGSVGISDTLDQRLQDLILDLVQQGLGKLFFVTEILNQHICFNPGADGDFIKGYAFIATADKKFNSSRNNPSRAFLAA